MFTGLVEAIGIVRGIKCSGGAHTIRIEEKTLSPYLPFGASIAVSGACLTVVESDSDTFLADIMKETWERTRFPKMRAGERVNLERPLQPGSRIDGHFVQGHVDGVGSVRSLSRESTATKITIVADEKIMRYAVEKGSVSLDGVSLTIAECGQDFFSVGLIPTTRKMTTLGMLAEGDPVNLEMDILGKYVYRFLEKNDAPLIETGGVTWDLLRDLDY